MKNKNEKYSKLTPRAPGGFGELCDFLLKDVKQNPCGNPDYCMSTFIDGETLTFGTGKLDDHGCWEFPCEACENEYMKYIEGEKNDD
jgi:hypothetical protein